MPTPTHSLEMNSDSSSVRTPTGSRYFPIGLLALAISVVGCTSGGGSRSSGGGSGNLDGTWAIDATRTVKAANGEIDAQTRSTLGTIQYVFQNPSKKDNPLADTYDGYYLVQRGGRDTGDFGAFRHVGKEGDRDVYTMFVGHRNQGSAVSSGGDLYIEKGLAYWTPAVGSFASTELVLHKKTGGFRAFLRRIRRSLAVDGFRSYNGRLVMKVRLSKTFHFEAAHDLPTFPPGHKCRRLHGHSFRFDVVIEGKVEPEKGYLIDYGDIKRAAEPLVKQLDHYYLNEIEGLSNPTSENLARWIWDHLKPALPQLSAIVVHETCTSSCEYHAE